jgi:transcriptional regulator with XRE-family HTH domain
LQYRQSTGILLLVISIFESHASLRDLGGRLRTARIARNESMAVFAARIGVSVPTLRAMERGAPTVQIGAWANALWALDRLEDLAALLAARESLLDLARARQAPVRRRAYARGRPRP